jgi:hypothetical protein
MGSTRAKLLERERAVFPATPAQRDRHVHVVTDDIGILLFLGMR